MRYFLMLVLAILLTGCGGGGSASSGGASTGGGATTGGGAVNNRTGVALEVTVKRTPAKDVRLATADDVQEALIDFLDPSTLEKIRPTTIVARTAPSVDVTIDVPVGRWILRIQGRTATGEVAGSRYESFVEVVEGQTTTVAAELNPAVNLAAIQVQPGPNALQAQGTTGQFTATAIFTDLTTQNFTDRVQWTSSNPSVANISATGLVLAVGNGTAVISARSGNVTGTSNLTVTPTGLTSLQVTPANATLAPGLTRQLTATGVFADNTNQNVTNQAAWVSSAPNVATVTNTGLVTAVSPGSATVRATVGNVSATATITVSPTLTRIELTPANVVVPVGSNQAVRAIGVFSDNTTQDLTSSVTWSVANPATATVTNTGVVSGVAAGNTSLTASSGSTSATASVRVEPVTLVRLTVSPTSAVIPKGATRNFTASGTFSNNSTRDVTQEVTWTSTNSSIVDISNASGQQGLATGVNSGQAVIEATLDGISQPASVNVTPATLVSISVSPANPAVGSGDLVVFRATGLFSDGTSLDLTTNVTWTSSNTSVVVISNASGTEGNAISTATGTATITAASGNVTASTGFTTKAPPTPPPPIPSPSPTAVGRLYTRSPSSVALYNNAATVTGAVGPNATATVTFASGMALDATRNLLYVGSDATVLRFDPATGLASNVTLTMPGGKAVSAVAVDSTNDRLYVSDSSSVFCFNNASTLSGSPAAFCEVRPFGVLNGLAIDPTTDRLFVAAGAVRIVDGISTRSGPIDSDAPFVRRLDQAINSQGLFIDTAGQRLWVVDSGDNSVKVFNPLDNPGSGQAPVQTITGLTTATSPWVDLVNNVLYLSFGGADGSIRMYTGASGLDGAAPAPSRQIDLNDPRNVIVDLTH